MQRIYHRYELWEDHKNGFYDNISGVQKDEMINLSVSLLSDAKKFRYVAEQVITEWVYSCEHNLTNEQLNRIAYIGQASCCLAYKVPSTITMEAWSHLTKQQQDEANKVADEILNLWINKNKQLCLKLD